MLSVVVDLLFSVAHIVQGALCWVFGLLFSTLYHSSVAITLQKKRELVALL